jgi:hypothetical protein
MPGKIRLCIFTHFPLPDRIGLFFEEFLYTGRLRMLGMHSDQLQVCCYWSCIIFFWLIIGILPVIQKMCTWYV